ncbi:MAG: hypothetical protein IJ504_06770 [Bacteroidales bacterium]|nr:hypothetical protein [Bacteroidales bacterium]
MKNRTLKLLTVILSALVLTLTSCNKVKDIKVTSVKIEAIAPQGLQGLNVFLAVGIDNPAFQVGLEDINGALKHSGKVLGRATMDPFVLWARSAEVYHLRAFVKLGEDATLKDLLMLTDAERLEECVIDVSVKIRLKNGTAVPLNIKDIPLKKLL